MSGSNMPINTFHLYFSMLFSSSSWLSQYHGKLASHVLKWQRLCHSKSLTYRTEKDLHAELFTLSSTVTSKKQTYIVPSHWNLGAICYSSWHFTDTVRWKVTVNQPFPWYISRISDYSASWIPVKLLSPGVINFSCATDTFGNLVNPIIPFRRKKKFNA